MLLVAFVVGFFAPRGRDPSLTRRVPGRMSALACRRLERWSVALLFVALAVVAGPADTPAQAIVRLVGTVNWVTGNTLVLTTDPLAAPLVYVIIDGYLVPAVPPPAVVEVDLSGIRQSDYSFMQMGERLAVIGAFDADRHVLVATALIRGADLQAPF